MHCQQLKTEIVSHQRLRDRLLQQFPDLDDETLSDTLEGITSLHEMIAEAIRSALDDQALVTGLKERLTEMKGRCDRLQFRADKKRQLALQAMNEADIRKLTQPDFTASTRVGVPALRIDAEDRIPQTYWVAQPPKLDRLGLLAALKAGETIEGAGLNPPAPSLSVRTK